MTGPGHYAKAEALLANAWRHVGDSDRDFLHTPETRALLIAQAQVHATLALTAATIEAADQTVFPHRPLVLRPTQGDDVDPAFPGSPWGRAFYGEAKS